jgi:hypothetical protein
MSPIFLDNLNEKLDQHQKLIGKNIGQDRDIKKLK